MHKYMILVEVPSTSLLYGMHGMNTSRKVRFGGFVKASNSSKACSKASEMLDVSYDKLKAMLCITDDKGSLILESFLAE